MALSNAERQAAYRARKRGEVAPEPEDPIVARLRARNLELEEEVRHLKAELAKRAVPHYSSAPPFLQSEPGFNTRPFTPVPKRR